MKNSVIQNSQRVFKKQKLKCEYCMSNVFLLHLMTHCENSYDFFFKYLMEIIAVAV